jgi:hypothetical protein
MDPLARDRFASMQRDANWLMAMWALANTATALEDGDIAETLYEMLLPFADRWVTATVSICFGPVAGTLGALATTLKRYDEAEGFLTGALETAERMELPLVRALAARQYAALLIARNRPGDRESAIALLDEVKRFGEDHGFQGLGTIAENMSELIPPARARRAKQKR